MGYDKNDVQQGAAMPVLSNTVDHASSERKEYVLTDRDFQFIVQFVYKHVGIVLTEEKRAMVYARISRRLRALKLDSFKVYCDLLERDIHKDELPNLINAITTNLTRFFREDHHFEHLTKNVLDKSAASVSVRPRMGDLNKVGDLNKATAERRKLRIWSAGCSTGEEPYSIAMSLLDGIVNPSAWDISILATDVDTNVLQTAQKGIYQDSQTISPALMKKYVDVNPDQTLSMRPILKDLIEFKQLNFLDNWTMKEPFDAIFCRNVVIYFDKETQKRLFAHMYDCLKPQGWLYIGHSESLYKICDQFKLMGRTIYQKNG